MSATGVPSQRQSGRRAAARGAGGSGGREAGDGAPRREPAQVVLESWRDTVCQARPRSQPSPLHRAPGTRARRAACPSPAAAAARRPGPGRPAATAGAARARPGAPAHAQRSTHTISLAPSRRDRAWAAQRHQTGRSAGWPVAGRGRSAVRREGPRRAAAPAALSWPPCAGRCSAAATARRTRPCSRRPVWRAASRAARTAPSSRCGRRGAPAEWADWAGADTGGKDQ
jgi:hypothetical protein